MDHGPWFWVSKAALTRAIAAAGPAGATILTGLARLESDAPVDKKPNFFASSRNIAEASGLGTRTVEKYLPLLERAGVIIYETGRGSGEYGAHIANRIRLLDVGPPSASGADAPASGAEASASDSYTKRGHKRNSPLKGERTSHRSARSGSKAVAAGEGSEETEPAFIAWK
jgi:hypothetical protein